MKLDLINSRIAKEIKSFDEAKQYLEEQKIILSFFNLQEMTAVVQAQISVDRKSSVKRSPYRQRRLMDFLEYRNSLSVRPDGPLWFRGYNQWTDEKGAPQITRVLKAYGADHIVVGHSVQKGGRIRPRFNGKVFLIDTGMLSSHYKGGRASALEIRGADEFFAHYTDQQNVQLEPNKTSMREDGLAHPSGARKYTVEVTLPSGSRNYRVS